MLGFELLAKTYSMKAQQARQVKDGFFSFSGKFLFKKQKKEKNVGPFLHDGIFDDDKDASTTPPFA